MTAAGRGGWGHLKNREEIEAQRQREVDETYGESGANRDVPTGERVPDEVRPLSSFSRTFEWRPATRLSSVALIRSARRDPDMPTPRSQNPRFRDERDD